MAPGTYGARVLFYKAVVSRTTCRVSVIDTGGRKIEKHMYRAEPAHFIY